jgi:hypothetical protein
MINLASRNGYSIKAATFPEACELPPDLNIKLHAGQEYFDTSFTHILVTRNTSPTLCIM